MKKCLFIDCCIRREESRTLQLAREFLDNLKGYEIEHLLLEEEGLKPLVGDFFFERQELLEGMADHSGLCRGCGSGHSLEPFSHKQRPDGHFSRLYTECCRRF